MEMRSQHKDAFMEKHGVKLGFMSGFVKVKALFALWKFNGSVIVYPLSVLHSAFEVSR